MSLTSDPSLAALLKARASHLREQDLPAAGIADSGGAALFFQARDLRLALPENCLLGLLRAPRAMPVPGTRACCLGAIAFRSGYLDLFSLFRLLGLNDPGGEPTHAAVCSAAGRTFALWCGEPVGFAAIPPPAACGATTPGWPAALLPIGDNTFLLDLTQLAESPDIATPQPL
jgi:hypothetical protein